MTEAMGEHAEVAGVSRSGKNSWLFAQVVFAIVAGAMLGHFYPDLAIKMKPLGDLFIKIIKLVITPVIFLTIVTGIAGARELNVLGKIATKAIVYFLVMSTFALVVGLAAADILHPGSSLNVDPATLDANSIKDYLSQAKDFTLSGFFSSIVPDSIVGALVGNNILQVVLIAILIGIGFSMAGERARPAVLVLESAAQGVFYVVQILMLLAPIGSFGAMAFTIGKFGLGAIVSLMGLVATFYLTAGIFIVVVLGSVSVVCGFSIFSLLNYLRDELFLVLGTSSSESVLSSLMEKLEACGCPRSVVGLVIPAGYSFNLDGTNIYMSLAALFIAQALNIHLSIGSQLSLLAVAMISSKGAAGVTGAGFITLAATLSIVPSIPIAGMALILGVDRFMSQCRALTNCIGNAVATIVISRWQGELDVAHLRTVLAGEAPKATLAEAAPA